MIFCLPPPEDVEDMLEALLPYDYDSTNEKHDWDGSEPYDSEIPNHLILRYVSDMLALEEAETNDSMKRDKRQYFQFVAIEKVQSWLRPFDPDVYAMYWLWRESDLKNPIVVH